MKTTTKLWPAPAIDRMDFSSWEEFVSYMEKYQQSTQQTFRKRSATSIKMRNDALKSIASTGKLLPTALLPEMYLDYARTLQCSYKHQVEGAQAHTLWNGEQPFECPAMVNVTLKLVDEWSYRICVTKAYLLHNHPLGGNASTISTLDPSTTSASSLASGLMAQGQDQGVKRRRVCHPPKHQEANLTFNHAAITDTSDVPTMTDVRGFLQHVKRVHLSQRDAMRSVEERLAVYVKEFASLDGNVAKIFVDHEKVLSSITLQTKHMRKVFEAFPEVLRVDAIPATMGKFSASSYRVFSLMVHDTLGNWQYVQHAIVESDRRETLSAALDQFKKYNAQHPRVCALIVPSEDLPQLEELRGNFPAARVLYSQFHVVRALHKAIAEYGKDLTSWHRDRLAGIAQVLVYAPTSHMYGANIAIMADVLGSKQHPFLRYFLNKWDSCRDRWTTFAREGVTTFTVSENNGRFAPTWKAIFAAANDKLALDETVAAIRYYQTVVECAFTRELNIELTNSSNIAIRHGSGSNSIKEYDAEMQLLQATVSPAVCSIVFPQYRYAMSRGAYKFFEPSRGSFFISAVAPNDVFCDDPSKEFCVDADRGWQCSCAFMVNHHLPCRHVFYVRRIICCSTVIPTKYIESRWVLAKAKYMFDHAHVGNSIDGVSQAMTSGRAYRNTILPPGSWQKFKTAQEVGKRISQRMMEMGPAEFDRAMQFYKIVESNLNMRPFNLNARAVARVNDANNRAKGAAVNKPNWVEPDSRTLAPRRGRPVVAGTMNAPVGDDTATLVHARKMQLAQLANSSRPRLLSSIINLLDESEEEEISGHLQQNERRHAGEKTLDESPRMKTNEATGPESCENEAKNQPGDSQDADKTLPTRSENVQDQDADHELLADEQSTDSDEEVSNPNNSLSLDKPWEDILDSNKEHATS